MEVACKSGNISLKLTTKGLTTDSLVKHFTCSICESFFKTPIELKCGHVFCHSCPEDTKYSSNITCPLCKCKTSKTIIRERKDIVELATCMSQLMESFSKESKRNRKLQASQTQPVDLSLKKHLDYYEYPKGSLYGIQFIKPLDLSCAKRDKDKSSSVCNDNIFPPCGNQLENEISALKSPQKDCSANVNHEEMPPSEDKTSAPRSPKSQHYGMSNDFESEYDMILKNCVLSDETVSAAHKDHQAGVNPDVNSIQERFTTACKSSSSNYWKETPKKPNFQTGKRILSLDDVSDENPQTKIQKTDNNATNSKGKLVNVSDRNANQTEETYFSDENKNEDGEMSDSDESVLAETPVKDTGIKRKSLRDIHSIVTDKEAYPKESESSAESVPQKSEGLPSNISIDNRQYECSEFPIGMFELSFDQIEEHSSGKENESRLLLLKETTPKTIRSCKAAPEKNPDIATPSKINSSKSVTPAKTNLSKSATPAKTGSSKLDTPAKSILRKLVTPVKSGSSKAATPAKASSSKATTPATASSSKATIPARPSSSKAATPDKTDSSVQPDPPRYLFCPTRLSGNQIRELQKLCKICKGGITKEYQEDVTHVILDLEQGRVPHTIKYLFAIAGKKWVITVDWVTKCLEEGKMVSEEPYETSNFPGCDVGVRKSRLTTTPLFKDFNFFIGGTMKSSGACVDDCKKLLLKLGANIIMSPGDVNENVMIVGDILDQTGTYQFTLAIWTVWRNQHYAVNVEESPLAKLFSVTMSIVNIIRKRYKGLVQKEGLADRIMGVDTRLPFDVRFGRFFKTSRNNAITRKRAKPSLSS